MYRSRPRTLQRRYCDATATRSWLNARGCVAVQIGQRSRDALEQGWYTRLGDSDIGGELNGSMPPRPRACAHRPQTTFLGAGGSAVAAGSTAKLRGGMGAYATQTLAVRLPRLMLCGAASHEHVLRMRTMAVWSESTAETCGSTVAARWGRCMSTLQCICIP